MKRREFIKNSCTTCLSISALSLGLGSCATLTNTTGKIVQDGLTLSTEEFVIKDKGNRAHRSFLVVRNDALQYPICIYRFSEEQYSALWMKCAHQGAELLASGDTLQCPAHGSEYNNKGQVTNGPASTNLRSFPVTVKDKEIFIDLRKQS